MTMYLFAARSPAIGSRMRGALTRLIFVVAVLIAGTHAPVFANEAEGHSAATFVEHCTHAAGLQDVEDGAPTDVGGESLHHHHCPIGLAGQAVGYATDELNIGALTVPPPVKPLGSLSSSPPWEPPLS